MIRKHKKTLKNAFDNYITQCVENNDANRLVDFDTLLDTIVYYDGNPASPLTKICKEEHETIVHALDGMDL